MQKSISWILKFASELPDNDEKVKCLQANAHPALLMILRYAYDPNIKWLLPEENPTYKPLQGSGLESMLYYEARKLYLFIEGGNLDLQQDKREVLFVRLLQAIHPDDAELLLSVKNKTLHYPLSKRLVKKAFPDLY